MNDKILVFIPCYNCAAQIGRVLAQFKGPIAARFFEVLVLDNGSKDGALEAAIAAAGQCEAARVTIGRNRENYNLGGSHKSAFAYASKNGFSHVVVLHGDDQGDIADLAPILAANWHNQYDACLGARFAKRSKLQNYSRFRIFGNRVFNFLFSLATWREVLDLGSGLTYFQLRCSRTRIFCSMPTICVSTSFSCWASSTRAAPFVGSQSVGARTIKFRT